MNKFNNYIQKLKSLHQWQKKKLIFWFLFTTILGIAYLGFTGYSLYTDKEAEASYWESRLQDNEAVVAETASLAANATEVTAGTYIDNIRTERFVGNVSIKIVL